MRSAAVETGARPINREAAEAIEDPEYRRVMNDYAARYRELSDRVWREEFAEEAVTQSSPDPV